MALMRITILSLAAIAWGLSAPGRAADALFKPAPAEAGEGEKAKEQGSDVKPAAEAEEEEGEEAPAAAHQRNTAIHTFALLLPFQVWNLGVERAFGEHNALVLDGYFNSQSFKIKGDAAGSGGGGSGDANADFALKGWGVAWRFSTRRLAGWFFGPKIIGLDMQTSAVGSLSGGTSTSETFKGTAQALLIGGEAGYQWVLGPGFLIELGLGAAQASISGKGEGDITDGSGNFDFNYNGMIPLLSFNLGWAF